MFSRSTSHKTNVSRIVEPQSSLRYPHRLNLYDDPPRDDITIDEFESCAIDRIRVLAEIESAYVRNRTYDELKSATAVQAEKYIPLNSNGAKAVDLDAQRKKDHLGHFVLRLAFCRSEELRRRFIKAETTLFRVRLDADMDNEKRAFLQSRNFSWELVKEPELSELANDLRTACSATKSHDSFYKVDWTRVPDLVSSRRVLLKGGKAYVPSGEQTSLVLQEFQDRLEQALDRTAKALPTLDEDDRILPILAHLSKGFLAGVPSEQAYSFGDENTEEITAEMVDDLAKRHFPLCMRNLHDNLRKDRHLKHFGRLQYGLFLKVLGLSIEEALAFWRKGFGGSISDDKFNKEHKYNIRHSYGLEGKRANYPALSCQRILTSNQPGATDSHGCPYRHFSPDNLSAALLSAYGGCGLSAGDLPELGAQVKEQHFHVACTRVFEITHKMKKGDGVGGGESVSHPNLYAKRSRELDAKRREAAEMVVKTAD